MLGVIHEVAEDGAVPGPFVRLAERKDPGKAAGLLQVMSMYRRLVVVMNPQSARACPELRAKARLVWKSCTDCQGAVRMEVL